MRRSKYGRWAPRPAALAAASLAFATAACSDAPLSGCREGSFISDRALLDRAVNQLIEETKASARPGLVQYESAASFFAGNPNCCHIERPRSYSGGGLALPFREQVTLTIIYRRLEGGQEPYYLRRVAIGPCPADTEEAGYPMSVSQFEQSKAWQRTWRIR